MGVVIEIFVNSWGVENGPTPLTSTVAFDQRPWPLHNRYTRTDAFSVKEWPLHIYSRYKFVTVRNL
jgi:hypothetical protein